MNSGSSSWSRFSDRCFGWETRVHKAYETGKGSTVLRSRTEIEVTKSGQKDLFVTEFPYMVNKTKVHEQHRSLLAQEKGSKGITAVRDPNREGVRLSLRSAEMLY